MSAVEVVCGDVFEAELPAGEARLVYADPPYTGEDIHGYGAAPDSERLLSRMLELGAPDAVYVLHTSWVQLHELLPVVERLAPPRPRYYQGQPKHRLLAWVKPWRSHWKPNIAFQYMWEPVVVFYGARYRYRGGAQFTEADWICALRQHRSLGAHPTQKPDEVVRWLFDRLLHGSQGRLGIDLYAGTGGAAIDAARRFDMDTIAVERNERMCATIVERIEASFPPARVTASDLTVRVTANGRPIWPTLGRAEPDDALSRDLLAKLRPVETRPGEGEAFGALSPREQVAEERVQGRR